MNHFLNLICCTTLCELLIYRVSTKFTEENVKKSNIYVHADTEFQIDKIAIYAYVATPCSVTSPPLKLL